MEHADTAALALAFAEDRGRRAETCPVLIALHARGGDSLGAVAEARKQFGDAPDVLAPQAARPCNPFQSNLQSDLPGAGGYGGFSWYLGEEAARPEAASFGDVLVQLDRFVRSRSMPFILWGRGQGGVLALALALLAPDGLVAVYASEAGLASIDGWKLPETRLGGIDFVLADFEAAQASRAREELIRREAGSVTFSSRQAAQARAWFEGLGRGERAA